MSFDNRRPLPSPGRFSRLRNHPLLVATGAASAGVLLGAYVAGQLLVTPVKQDNSARAVQAAAQTRAVQAAAETKASAAAETNASAARAETTGSVSAGDSAAIADCDRQTWPYLSRNCVEQTPDKTSSLRVVAPDNIDRPTIGAIEAPPAPANTATPAAPTAPAAAAAIATTTPAPATTTPASATTPPTIPTPPVEATPVATTPSEPAPPAAITAQVQVPPQPPAKAEAKAKHERVAKKAKRKPKDEFKKDGSARPDDDDAELASDDRGERNARPFDRRSRRIVERWTEREYDVPAYDGRGQRRVIVIRRNGGMFDGLFGGFGN